MNKLQKALIVVKDLKTLEFKCNDHDGTQECVYTIVHPEGKYSIWTANGFWFTLLYEIDGKSVDRDSHVSKFGAIGKILVWWETLKVVSKFKQQRKLEKQDILSKLL